MEKIKATLAKSKMFSWVLTRHELWIWNRHNVALGAAIGVFMGLLIPFFQVPISALLSVFLKAHVGVASLTTLITNPITFGPVYYFAFKFGEYITGIKFVSFSDSDNVINWMLNVGAPLVVGLGFFAMMGFTLTYGFVYFLFEIKFKRKNV